MLNLTRTYDGDNVPKSTKWIYSVVAIFRDAAYTLVALFLITYIQYSGILSSNTAEFAAMFGVLTGLVIGYRIFDALNDPFMGVIIEKIHFKTGKYKPWILIGGCTNALVVLCLFLGPTVIPALHGWAYVAWFAVFYLLWGITFTMNDIAYWGILPSLTSESKQRTSITTLMAIFCSVGQFIVAGLAPVISGALGYTVYIWISIICASLLCISQLLLFLFMKEHRRNIEEEKKHPVPRFKDMFTVLKQNDQVRIMSIVLFLYYLGSGILNALGLNYFYFSVNYSVGSSIMTIFTVVYGLGVILSQFLFPLLSKKFSRKQLLMMTFIGIVVGYVAFYLYGMPIGGGNYLSAPPINGSGDLNFAYVIPLCLIGLVIFFSQGLFYMVLLIMMTNTIEYNEFKFGERKEAVIFSLRPLTTKLGSAIQQGVLYFFLFTASLLGVITTIGNLQQANAADSTTTTITDVNNGANAATAGIDPWQVAVFKLGVAVLPLILFIGCFIIIKAKYKIDEQTYKNMVEEIKKRNESTKEVEDKKA